MTAVALTAKQAKALGITATDPTPSTPTRRRRARSPYSTVCHDCGETFTTQAAETRHLDATRHCRYQLDIGRPT